MEATLWLVVALTCLLGTPGKSITVPWCPSQGMEATNCECIEEVGRSGLTVKITCTFDNTKQVLLTDDLYPFRESRIVSAYVRIADAASLRVSRNFLEAWQAVPSQALDVWRVASVKFESVGEAPDPHAYSPYRTSVGIGIVHCNVPEIPPKFLSNRDRGGLRIQNSRVGVIRKNALFNIKEMRYLVVENSEVSMVEGPMAAEGVFTLSQRLIHSWTGFHLQNVTIDSIASNAFNITHKNELEMVEIANSRFGELKSDAFSVFGNLNVSLNGNIFSNLEKGALQVSVGGELRFSQNLIESWHSEALRGVKCQGPAAFEGNTMHVVEAEDDEDKNSTRITPFHSSCGRPQIFTVVTDSFPLSSASSAAAPWTMGVIAVLLLILLIAGVLMYRRRGLMLRHYRRDTLVFLRERKSDEPVTGAEDRVTGVANPVYEEGATSEEQQTQ